ncbi:MAG: metal-dependent hydrolase [Bryobacteraceae bacterium]|jgi:uncharacterized membrane protein
MFIGHFAVGFAAKRFAPRSSESVLLTAPLLADILWPVFLLLDWEQVRIDPGNTRFTPFDFVSYPWSHSLLMLCVWATAFGAIYYAITRYWAGAIAIWIGVVSHWVLDWITHRPDMPLYPGGARYGLGLWNSISGTMVVEILMFSAGVWMYVHATRAKDRIGRYAFIAYIVLLLLIYVANAFGTAPGSVTEVAWAAIALPVVFIPWAWWFDRHRGRRGELA